MKVGRDIFIIYNFKHVAFAPSNLEQAEKTSTRPEIMELLKPFAVRHGGVAEV
jgi:hypothetical protein